MIRRFVLVACAALTLFGAREVLAEQRRPTIRKPPAAAVSFYLQVRAQIAKHDWKGLLRHADPKHLETQRKLGMGDAQYLAELLGLHMAGNSIKRGDTVELSDLARITKVVIASYRADGSDVVTATGYVVLAGGSKLTLRMMSRRMGKRYVLFGAVG